MKELFDLLPKKLITALIIILALIWGLSYGLKVLNFKILEQSEAIKKSQTLALEDIKNKIQNESGYRDFIHFFALKTLFNTKKSSIDGIDKISQILPKYLKINSFYFSNSDNAFIITGQVNGMDDFLRIAKYFDTTERFKNVVRTQSSQDGNIQIKLSGIFTK